MSYGFTGRVFSIFSTRSFRTVTLNYVGEYETDDERTTKYRSYKRIKLKSRWLAELYNRRINKGDYARYNGTVCDTGFRKT